MFICSGYMLKCFQSCLLHRHLNCCWLPCWIIAVDLHCSWHLLIVIKNTKSEDTQSWCNKPTTAAMKLETSFSLLEILLQISPRCQPQPPRQVNTRNYSARLCAPHQISTSVSQCFLTRLSLTAIKAVLADGKHVKTNLPFAQSCRGRLLAYAARREISRSELIPEGWETYLWDTGR